MTPPPKPLVIDKGDFRLIFNEPAEQAAISIECLGGRLTMFLDDNELEKLSRVTWRACKRIRGE